jgi:aryl-alcohol dehydrogenase-like predicted oxidoreductase
MRYKLLGKSGLRVSELCLGTMTFGEDWGWGASIEESQRIFDHYAEVGGNFIDTSVNYTNGTSEKYLGEFTKTDRDHFVIATKYTLTTPDQTDPNQGGNSRKNMRHSVERSLKQLQTDYIDLLYLHMWDFMTPVEEVLRGLDDLVHQGKVNYIGISDSPAWIVAEANARAELRGWSRFIGLQIPYSLRSRAVERAELPMAKHWDMAVMPFGLLNGGTLSGKYNAENSDPKRYDIETLPEDLQSLVVELGAVAGEIGRPPSQVAINWVRQQMKWAQIIPILGVRTIDQLKDNLSCLEWELTGEHLERLDDASKIVYDFPLGWLAGAGEYVYGATLKKIDTHRDFPLSNLRTYPKIAKSCKMDAQPN